MEPDRGEDRPALEEDPAEREGHRDPGHEADEGLARPRRRTSTPPTVEDVDEREEQRGRAPARPRQPIVRSQAVSEKPRKKISSPIGAITAAVRKLSAMPACPSRVGGRGLSGVVPSREISDRRRRWPWPAMTGTASSGARGQVADGTQAGRARTDAHVGHESAPGADDEEPDQSRAGRRSGSIWPMTDCRGATPDRRRRSPPIRSARIATGSDDRQSSRRTRGTATGRCRPRRAEHVARCPVRRRPRRGRPRAGPRR